MHRFRVELASEITHHDFSRAGIFIPLILNDIARYLCHADCF